MLRSRKNGNDACHNSQTSKLKRRRKNRKQKGSIFYICVKRPTLGILAAYLILMGLMFTYKQLMSSSSSSSGETNPKISGKNIRSFSTANQQVIGKSGDAVGSINESFTLSSSEDEELEFDPKDKNRLHLIFSTDCSPYQHWQSYLVYFSALKVRQPGHVTRIASGCNDDEAILIQKWFDQHISHMSKRFHLHLTPHFSKVKNEAGKVKDYKFFNKPFGLRHWMENSPLVKANPTDGSSVSEDDIVILIDPDMALLRPITGNFENRQETIIGKRKQDHAPFDTFKVEHGKPFAQTYGFGAQWSKNVNLNNVVDPDSPAKLVERLEGGLWYPAGPPYLATVRDMYQISQKWTEYVPKVYDEYPHLLAEMFAYCTAAAHLQLKHKLVDSLMISNNGAGGEGWPLIDKIPADEACDIATNPHHSKYPLPAVVHFCQRYALGDDWFFGKRKVPKDIFTCEKPLLAEPPSNLALLYDYKKPPGQKDKKNLSPIESLREAFVLCALLNLTNEAATFYKQSAHFCPAGTANLDKTLRIGSY